MDVTLYDTFGTSDSSVNSRLLYASEVLGLLLTTSHLMIQYCMRIINQERSTEVEVGSGTYLVRSNRHIDFEARGGTMLEGALISPLQSFGAALRWSNWLKLTPLKACLEECRFGASDVFRQQQKENGLATVPVDDHLFDSGESRRAYI